ncbi:MAG TPA: efflux RND transporter permease subunit, partial [Candidatus Berkiella sp.]|nr:efflux RND transporter permease subunit [Candidatus Berkiella sp.]
DKNDGGFTHFIDRQFEKLQKRYEHLLHGSLNYLPVVVVFAVIILSSNYFLFITAKSELAPQEDQGILISMLTAAPNANIDQTKLFSRLVYEDFAKYSETDHVFQLDGVNGLNSSIAGMVLKPWDERNRTADQLQHLVQTELSTIAGLRCAVFQPAPLPGSSGMPVEFVIGTTEDYNLLNEVKEIVMDKALKSGMFAYLDPDLKIDKAQTTIELNRDKASELGLTMQDIGNVLASSLSENYINFFSLSGRSYQVIPQVKRVDRLNEAQLLDYYITASNGTSVPLSTIADIKTTVVPESINHFQQINSTTISGVPMPGVTVGDALAMLENIAKEVLPSGYSVDYA